LAQDPEIWSARRGGERIARMIARISPQMVATIAHHLVAALGAKRRLDRSGTLFAWKKTMPRLAMVFGVSETVQLLL